MKTLKRAAALLLAIMLIAAVPAMAATITINGAYKDITYKAYKIFDVTTTTSGNGYAYTIAADSVWKSVVDEYIATLSADATTGKKDIELTLNSIGSYNVTFNNNGDDVAKAFANYLVDHFPNGAEVAGETSVSNTDVAGADGRYTLTMNNLEAGYYLVTSTLGTAVATLTSSNDSAEVKEKNSLPSIEKKIVTATDTTGTDSTTAKVGDKVDFKVTVKADGTSNNVYVIHDTMSNGLTLDTTAITVEKQTAVDGTTYTQLSAGTDYTLTISTTENTIADGCTFEITINESVLETLSTNQEIVITYSATLDADAVADNDDTNEVKLVYNQQTKTDVVTVNNYGFDLVKTDDSSNVITGAQFKLYSDEACTNEIALVKVTDSDTTYYRPIDTTKTGEDAETAVEYIEAGQATIKGLANGTYYLKETKAPDGYNALTTAEPVKIADADQDAKFTGDDDDNPGTYIAGTGVQIKNQSGSTVPVTGGMGTAIFYVLGSILLIGAGVILVARKRMESK